MYSVCQIVIEDGTLEETLEGFTEAEKMFNDELGVLERNFYQCIQQPHVVWANTRWKSEGHHNKAAASLMEVRADDRIASAYFRPGLYYEIFADPPEDENNIFPQSKTGECVVVCHGIVSDKHSNEPLSLRLPSRMEQVKEVQGLLSCEVYFNNYAAQEFVAFLGWSNHEDYLANSMIDKRTVEEVLFAGKPYELSSYIQYECNNLLV